MKPDLSLVHPDLRQAIKTFPRFTITRNNIWFWRLMMKFIPSAPSQKDVRIENILITSHDGRMIRLRVYQSTSQASSALVLIWFHGGGFLIGNPEQDDLVCAHYAREAGVVVVSVDYRYAPEHPFPVGLEDGYSALKWITANAKSINADPDRIAIGGASAGGGLAASLIQLVHDRAEFKPKLQLLIYPMLDDRTCLREDIVDHGFLTWTMASNRLGWESYLGHAPGSSVKDYSVPSRRNDLSGLPPAWIGVGTLDLFHDEDCAYAGCLKSSGVECELLVLPGVYHGFDIASDHLKVVSDFRQSQIAMLKKYL